MRRVRLVHRYCLVVVYTVQTPVFEGPFDLLLHLITKEQVDLYEVSLSTIVDAYLGELQRMQDARAVSGESLDLDVATEFLLIAATLVELKSRRLLPNHENMDLEDEFALWEERDLLLSRLFECKTFKDAARALSELAATAQKSLPRRSGLEDRFMSLTPDLLAGVTPEKLRRAFIKTTTPTPVPRVDLFHVTPIKANVADSVQEIAGELRNRAVLSFRHLTQDLVDRIEVIVRFLAVLELYKQGYIDIDQANTFGELELRWIGDDRDVIDLTDGDLVVPLDVYEG